MQQKLAKVVLIGINMIQKIGAKGEIPTDLMQEKGDTQFWHP